MNSVRAADISVGENDLSGHLPATRARLSAILERVGRGNNEFTLAERVFVAACEFWVLAMGRELHALTNLRAIGKLRFAAMVFEAIGAVGVAGALQAAHIDMVQLKTQAQRRGRLMLLEERLLLSREPVDILLAHLADNLASAEATSRPAGTRPARQALAMPTN
jgi:hypothetical protein